MVAGRAESLLVVVVVVAVMVLKLVLIVFIQLMLRLMMMAPCHRRQLARRLTWPRNWRRCCP